MAASSFTLQLPAGTATTKLINLPTAGSWLGGQVVSIAVLAAATITLTIIKKLPGGGTSSRIVWNNVSFPAESRSHVQLKFNETMAKIVYTSTQEISFAIECNTTAVAPA